MQQISWGKVDSRKASCTCLQHFRLGNQSQGRTMSSLRITALFQAKEIIPPRGNGHFGGRTLWHHIPAEDPPLLNSALPRNHLQISRNFPRWCWHHFFIIHHLFNIFQERGLVFKTGFWCSGESWPPNILLQSVRDNIGVGVVVSKHNTFFACASLSAQDLLHLLSSSAPILGLTVLRGLLNTHPLILSILMLLKSPIQVLPKISWLSYLQFIPPSPQKKPLVIWTLCHNSVSISVLKSPAWAPLIWFITEKEGKEEDLDLIFPRAGQLGGSIRFFFLTHPKERFWKLASKLSNSISSDWNKPEYKSPPPPALPPALS